MTQQDNHVRDTQLGQSFDALSAFSAATEAQRLVSSIWAAHTWVYRHFAATPRLDFCADEPGSGKTVNMDVTVAMSANPLVIGYGSQSSIYGWLDQHPDTTFGFDEIDKAFGADGRKTSRPIMASVVNDAYIPNGKVMVTRGTKAVLMPTFCPVAMAGLGRLPQDTETRSLMMHMHKGTPDEVYISPLHDGGLAFIGSEVKEWITAGKAIDYLTAQPNLAEHIAGDPRERLLWAPLAAIASYAGCWEQFRAAVHEIQTGIVDSPPTPLWALFLADLRASWPDDGPSIATGDEVIEWVSAHDLARFSHLQPGRIGNIAVAGMLRQAGITSTTSNGTRGYRRDDVYGGQS